MVVINQIIPEGFVRSLAYHADCQRAKLGNRAFERQSVNGKYPAVGSSWRTKAFFQAGWPRFDTI